MVEGKMMVKSGEMHLTKNFSYAGAIRSEAARKAGISNEPHGDDVPAILNTAYNMERVRRLLGDSPIIINSWYRDERVNRLVGGVANSAHRLGHAVDFTCPAFGSVTDVCRAIADSGIEFEQLIWEYGRGVHISFAPAMRGQVLHIKHAGQYLKGLPK